MRKSKKYKTLSSFFNVIKQFPSSNFFIRPTWETKERCLGPTKCDNARLIWLSSLGGIGKRMKRNPAFWSNGRHQLLKQLSRMAENGATLTILNAIWVQSVVMNIQDLYCGVGKIPPRSKGQGVLCDLTKENSNKNFMISQKDEKLWIPKN